MNMQRNSAGPNTPSQGVLLVVGIWVQAIGGEDTTLSQWREARPRSIGSHAVRVLKPYLIWRLRLGNAATSDRLYWECKK